MEHESSPEEIDQLRRQVERLKMEEYALAKETDAASVERLDALRRDLADKEEELRGLESRWEREKDQLHGEGELRRQLDQLKIEADKLLREGDLQAASEINYGQIPTLEKQIAEVEKAEQADVEPLVGDEVGAEQIADVVEAWTGIPTGKMLQGETAKLLEMETVIGARLIGQAAAVNAVSDAVRRSRAGIADPNRPTGSFLFLGPTGTGKTELAKSLADFLFDDERAIVRIDMSEYGEKHSVSRRSQVAWLRRLRRGRPADRGRASASLQRRAARRGREGPPGGLRRPAAGARRRSPHRRPGPHGRLPQHAAGS